MKFDFFHLNIWYTNRTRDYLETKHCFKCIMWYNSFKDNLWTGTSITEFYRWRHQHREGLSNLHILMQLVTSWGSLFWTCLSFSNTCPPNYHTYCLCAMLALTTDHADPCSMLWLETNTEHIYTEIHIAFNVLWNITFCISSSKVDFSHFMNLLNWACV